MPIHFTAPDGADPPDDEGPMFASTPLWERRAPGRGRGRRAPEPRIFGKADAEPRAGEAKETLGAADEPPPFSYQAIKPEPERRGMPIVLIAAGVAAVAAAAALGWSLTRPHDSGVAELTPGAPARPLAAPTMVAASPAPLIPVPAPVTAAPVAPAAAPAPAPDTTPPRRSAAHARDTSGERARGAAATARQAATARLNRESASRVRPAGANEALETGVPASTTAPMVSPPPPRPSPQSSTGPTLDMPPEQIAPSLDPTRPAPRTSPGAATPPGDAATP